MVCILASIFMRLWAWRAFDALAFKIEMLWVMIDTIHHAYVEP